MQFLRTSTSMCQSGKHATFQATSAASLEVEEDDLPLLHVIQRLLRE